MRRLVEAGSAVALVMSPSGRAAISIPPEVATFNAVSDFTDSTLRDTAYFLVSNANSSLPDVLRAARELRRSKVRVTTSAIVHNYAEKFINGLATKVFLRMIDVPIAVEPGLRQMRPDILIPPWLSLEAAPPAIASPIHRTGKVKTFARPDRSKGLHLLPAIYRRLAEKGYVGEVAVGASLQTQSAYKQQLEIDLSPWKVEGPRNADWIDAGDIFLVPSISGEAVCLAAQEAMGRGAYVVSSRLGLLPYMSSSGTGIRTFAVGDVADAARLTVEALEMDHELFVRECKRGNEQMRERAGLWYASVVELMVKLGRS